MHTLLCARLKGALQLNDFLFGAAKTAPVCSCPLCPVPRTLASGKVTATLCSQGAGQRVQHLLCTRAQPERQHPGTREKQELRLLAPASLVHGESHCSTHGVSQSHYLQGREVGWWFDGICGKPKPDSGD